MYISVDETGRITSAAEKPEYLIDPIEFEFPSDFDFSTIGEYIVENGVLKYSKSQGAIQAEIDYCKVNLYETDYIIAKISEAMALGEDYEPLIEQYQDTIELRKEWREKINELEKELC